MNDINTDTIDGVAALRAKLICPDPRDDISAVNIRNRTPDVQMWSTRKDADVALRQLRERGLNVGKGIRVQPAYDPSTRRSWVITKLGDFGEVMLMTESGSWVPGQLLPERPTGPGSVWLRYEPGSVWMPYEGAALEPATFTHVTSTALDATARRERYKTKSNGSCGRYVWSDDSVARCTCGWKRYEDTRAEAQAAARVHRLEAAA